MSLSRLIKPVKESERIVGVPFKELPSLETVYAALDVLKKPGGSMDFRPIQAMALWEAYNAGGLFGMIGVGHGKTLLTMLLCRALGIEAKDTVILLRPRDVEGFVLEAIKYSDHFHIPTELNVHTYSELSTNWELIEKLKPKLIIADEAHNLKNPGAARTRRFLRYMRANRDTIFCAVSGTITSDGIEDLSHLLNLALKDGSPLPQSYNRRMQWAACLDARSRMPPGPDDWAQMQPLVDMFFPEGGGRDLMEFSFASRKEIVREAFHRRLTSTPGIISTTESAIDIPVQVELVKCDSPPAVLAAIKTLEDDWELPDGGEITDGLQIFQCKQQLASGFFYYWDWPGEVDREWIQARSRYNKAMAAVVKLNVKGFDTPGLIARALKRGKVQALTDTPVRRLAMAELVEATGVWNIESLKPEPPQAVEWIDLYAVNKAVELAEDLGPCLIWYSYKAQAEALRAAGIHTLNPGDPIPSTPCVLGVSISSHGTSENRFVPWHKNIILTCPSSGLTLEQLIGRTHRPGQLHEHVEVYILDNQVFQASYKNALAKAEYIQTTTGTPQKLLMQNNLKIV